MATVANRVRSSRHCASIAASAALLAISLSTMGCNSHSGGYEHHIRVAFLGNSYTFYNNMPYMLEELSAEIGIKLVHAQVAFDGSSIFDKANLKLDIGQQTKELLEDPDGWDFVVLQDQSQVPGGGKDEDEDLAPDVGRNMSLEALRTFFPALLSQANATPVLFATWGRLHGDPYNADCCGYGDFLSMNNLTTEGYKMYADVLKEAAIHNSTVLTAPCGEAFKLAHLDGEDSLFDGLFAPGDYWGHPSLLGSYLVANIFFGVIHGRSPRGLTWAPKGISAANIEAVQRWAHTVVFEETNLGHIEDNQVFSVA